MQQLVVKLVETVYNISLKDKDSSMICELTCSCTSRYEALKIPWDAATAPRLEPTLYCRL